jgi:hypothetical protein
MALTNPYIIALRAGKVNVATALLKPQTTQSYSANTINTKQFLKERGYDISKPESIPNSVFYKSSTKSAARVAAEKRTADLKLQAAQKAQAERERQARMITVSNNSKNLPNYTAQTQRDFSDTTKYKVHGNNNSVSNNNVIANDVWVDPNVTVTGQSKTSRPSSSSIAANENYNTATAMNDFMSANPSSDINMGIEIRADPIWWKSSAPQDNEVKTSDLGGDIQHQETDSNTNVGYLPFQNQIPSNTNWSSSMPSMASTGVIILGGLAALLLLGRKK